MPPWLRLTQSLPWYRRLVEWWRGDRDAVFISADLIKFPPSSMRRREPTPLGRLKKAHAQ